MTVSALITRNDITATASQTSFTYTFRVLAATDMDVYQNGVLLSSGYTVNNVGTTTGGTVVLDTGVPVGQIVSLVLAMPLDRTTDYQNSGKFLAGDVNGDFDKIYIGAIQNENLNDRSLRLKDVEPPTSGVDMTLPLKADRKGKYLSFNSVTGAPEVVAETGGSVTDASLVNYTPAGTGAVATTVQAKLRESVSVKDFGAVGDGTTDDTAAIQAAADYCVTNSKKLHAPSGYNYLITSQIDLRLIKGIEFLGNIRHNLDTFIPVIMGSSSNLTWEYDLRISRIIWNNQPGDGRVKANLPDNPQLRIVGLKNASVYVHDVEYIQLFADADDAKYFPLLNGATSSQSTAYNKFYINECNLVEFNTNPSPSGSPVQWINENWFMPGRIRRILMAGTYSHNNNTFYSQGMETNGEIVLTTGFSNKFYDFRMEGTGIIVTFGPGHNNYVTQSYSALNYESIGAGTPTVTYGTGSANVFMRDYEQFSDKVTMFSLCNGGNLDGINKGLSLGTVDKSGVSWDANSTFTKIFETDFIPVCRWPWR